MIIAERTQGLTKRDTVSFNDANPSVTSVPQKGAAGFPQTSLDEQTLEANALAGPKAHGKIIFIPTDVSSHL